MQPQVQAAPLTRDLLFDFRTLPAKERNKLLPRRDSIHIHQFISARRVLLAAQCQWNVS
jgi:hypothetical protein